MKKSRRSTWILTNSTISPAITQFFSFSMGQGLRLFIVRPSTGKTHQIRVALKSLGSGIIGDPLYSSTQADRGYLHAYSLGFSYQGEYCGHV